MLEDTLETQGTVFTAYCCSSMAKAAGGSRTAVGRAKNQGQPMLRWECDVEHSSENQHETPTKGSLEDFMPVVKGNVLA